VHHFRWRSKKYVLFKVLARPYRFPKDLGYYDQYLSIWVFGFLKFKNRIIKTISFDFKLLKTHESYRDMNFLFMNNRRICDPATVGDLKIPNFFLFLIFKLLKNHMGYKETVKTTSPTTLIPKRIRALRSIFVDTLTTKCLVEKVFSTYTRTW